jgi:hypothetical protein
MSSSGAEAEVLPVVIRPLDAGDVAFVARSWLKSMRKDFHVADAGYYPVHSPIVNGLLERGETLIAADPEALFHIYGFVCFSKPNVLHYAYTKQLFRKVGVARRLLEAAGLRRPLVCSYLPDKGRAFAARLGATHDPYQVLR